MARKHEGRDGCQMTEAWSAHHGMVDHAEDVARRDAVGWEGVEAVGLGRAAAQRAAAWHRSLGTQS